MTAKAEFNVWDIRSDFPMLQRKMHGKPLIYLDSAATTHKPQSVIDEICHFYSEHYGTVHRAVYELAASATARYDNVRLQVQKFIHAAHLEEIVFTKGTTDGINLVAKSFGKAFLHPGDEILITETEHHSNIVPWQLLCEEKKAILKVIPVKDSSEIDMDAFARMLTDKVKLVSVAHIANSTGTQHPIEEIIKLSHAKGAKVLIDGAQAVAHLEIDVQKIDADFYAFSGHKMYGPTGIGILYGKKELLEAMPPYQGGGDMIEEVSFSHTTYQKPPLKFEAGTPSIAEVMGLGAAIDYLNKINLDRIHRWEQKLLEYATKKLLEIPHLLIIGTAPQKGSIITFVVPGVHALDIGTLLDLKGIAIRTGHLCTQPTLKKFKQESVCRMSFGMYNTFEEIDLFIEALKEVLLLLAPTMSF